MSIRSTAHEFFNTRESVQTQEPVVVQSLQTEPLSITLDSNTTLIVIFSLGLVTIAGLIGLFAYLGSRGDGNKECKCNVK